MFQVNGFIRQSATRHFGPKQPALDKGVPAGYKRALINGQPATYNGRPVYAKFSGSTLVSLVYT